MLRRTRAEVGRELPALSKIPHEIESDGAALERITGDAVALAKTILAHNETYRGEKMRAAGEFDQLVRQATGVAKAPYVAEFVRLLLESGQQVLLFGWHREVYSIWREKLADYNPVMYTGTESPKEKQAAKDAFVAGDSRLMLISLRAGAGIDGLQHACSTVVFGELDWSPGVHEQCIGRIHRDGQREPVQAFFLISNEGSDPIVSDVLGVKLEQIEGVRNPGEHLVERRDLGENQLRQLAQRFLADHGVRFRARAIQPRFTSNRRSNLPEHRNEPPHHLPHHGPTDRPVQMLPLPAAGAGATGDTTMSSTQHQLIEQCTIRLRGIVEALDNIHETSPQRWSTDLDDVHSSAESLLALINDQAPPSEDQLIAAGLSYPLAKEDAVKLWYPVSGRR